MRGALRRRPGRTRPSSSGSAWTNGEDLNDLLVEAFAVVREAARRAIGQRHFDVQLMGGAALHFGWIAEMKTGEGKTLVSTLPVYLNALDRQGRPPRHGQRLPGPPRRRVDGPDPPLPRPDRRPGRRPRSTTGRPRRPPTPADITYGTNTEFGFDYLRDNMARSLRAHGPARPRLRHRRRGRLDPHRRGPDAAHHLRPVDRVGPALLPVRRHRPDPDPRRRLRGRRGEAHRRPDRGRASRRSSGRSASTTSTTWSSANLRPPADPGAAGQGALQAGQGLHRRRRRGEDRRRVHRPHPRGPALVRRPAPGGRGQGAGADQGGEPHLGHGHPPELLPPVREAGRHDRHGRDRGRPSSPTPTTCRSCRSRPTSRWSAPTSADLIYKTEEAKFEAVVDDIVERYETGQPVLVGTASVEKSEVLSRHARASGASRTQVLNAKQHAREAADRRPGRPAARRHRGHQHGRPRRRHPPRRQPRGPGRARRCVAAGPRPRDRRGPGPLRRAAGQVRGGVPGRGRQGPRARRPLRARHRAPRVPPHRQPAAGPLRPPGRPGREPLLPVARGRADAPVRHRRHELGDGPGPARRRADRGQDGHQGHRAGPEHRRGPQRRDPQGRPQVRRGDERAAQGDLRPAPARSSTARTCASSTLEVLLAGAIESDRRRPLPDATSPRTGTSRAWSPRSTQYYPTEFTVEDLAEAGTADELYESLLAEALELLRASASRRMPGGAETDARSSSARSCSRSSTSSGASTSPRWTTCGRASTCGPWASRTRWSRGSARASRCSAS